MWHVPTVRPSKKSSFAGKFLKYDIATSGSAAETWKDTESKLIQSVTRSNMIVESKRSGLTAQVVGDAHSVHNEVPGFALVANIYYRYNSCALIHVGIYYIRMRYT